MKRNTRKRKSTELDTQNPAAYQIYKMQKIKLTDKRWHKFSQYRWNVMDAYWDEYIPGGDFKLLKNDIYRIRDDFMSKFNTDPRDPNATRREEDP